MSDCCPGGVPVSLEVTLAEAPCEIPPGAPYEVRDENGVVLFCGTWGDGQLIDMTGRNKQAAGGDP